MNQEPLRVKEPAMAYGVNACSIDNFIASLPKDAMHQLIDFAITEHQNGRCIPNSQIDDLLDSRLGWK